VRIRNGRLYEESGESVTALDLETREECARYAVLPDGSSRVRTSVLDLWEDGDRLIVARGRERWGEGREEREDGDRGRGSASDGALYLDVFERRSGEQLGRHEVPCAASRPGTGLAWLDGRLYIAGPQGLDVFVPKSPTEFPGAIAGRAARWVPALPAADSRAVTIDGRTDEWPDESRLALDSPGSTGNAAVRGEEAHLFVAHDGVNLYLALSHAAEAVHPRPRGGAHTDGNALEIALTTHRRAWRWAVGLDRRGEIFSEAVGRYRQPPRCDLAVRQDVAGGRLTYELAIPLREICQQARPGWHEMGLSIAVWDGAGGRGAPRPVAAWGRGLGRGETFEEGCEPLELDDGGQAVSRERSAHAASMEELERLRQELLDTGAEGDLLAPIEELIRAERARHAERMKELERPR
jgi:hypothetical protein